MSGTRVLVTGGAGFIGSAVCRRLAAAGLQVRVLDDLSTGRAEHCEDAWELHVGDVAERGAVDEATAGCDAVVHLAAFVSVPASFDRPEECQRTNVEGTRVVLDACRRHGVRKLVFASSCAVYAETGDPVRREGDAPGPSNPYAESKLEGERLLGAADQASTALRFFNVYGPRQPAGSGYAAAVPNFMHAAVSGEDLCIFGDGRQTRDFVFVGDVAEAVYRAAAGSATGVYNVGTGRSTPVLELAETVVRLAGSVSSLRFEPARAGDARAAEADVRRAARALEWCAATSLEEGLRETLAWWREAAPAA